MFFDQRLKTSTRLIILLTITVSIVMAVATYIPLRDREKSLRTAAQNEVEAHALTLQLALEEDFNSGRRLDAQRLINRLSENENAGIYGVILFNAAGELTLVSETLVKADIRDTEEARQVIKTGNTLTIKRRVKDTDLLTVILPLRINNQIDGAIEISAPFSFVDKLINENRASALLTWFLLCFAIFLVVVIVTNRSLMRPINALLSGADAVSRGDLTHRIHVPESGKEFVSLASAFNRMAKSLEEQRVRAEKQTEERLRLERQLRHSERLAAVGHLAAGVAHEMGAPLQVIDGRAKQLQDAPTASPEKQSRNLQIIRTQTERITRIVRSLLNLSRPYYPRLVLIDLVALVTQTIEALEVQLNDANIRVMHVCPQKMQINGDKDLLGQVLLNLCINAIHAMPDGGELRIEYELSHTPLSEENYIVLSVFDTGLGINPEHLENIFDPFFTTKEVGHGTGLGLAVSRRILEEHRGWIEANNWTEGGTIRGAVFAVHLPLPLEVVPMGMAQTTNMEVE